MLKSLKNRGVLTAVLSNKADYAVQDLCQMHFGGLLDVAAGEKENMGIPKKPAPDGVFDVISKLGTHISNTVYVGDSEVDIETAKNAGVDLIAVDWGFRSRQTLEENGASVIASTPSELARLILN